MHYLRWYKLIIVMFVGCLIFSSKFVTWCHKAIASILLVIASHVVVEHLQIYLEKPWRCLSLILFVICVIFTWRCLFVHFIILFEQWLDFILGYSSILANVTQWNIAFAVVILEIVLYFVWILPLDELRWCFLLC